MFSSFIIIMKKLTYIVLGLSLVAVFSCQKEHISPCGSHDMVQPEWNDSRTFDKKVDNNGKVIIDANHLRSTVNPNEVLDGSSTDDFSDTQAGLDGDITDPNNDPDKGRKKGR